MRDAVTLWKKAGTEGQPGIIAGSLSADCELISPISNAFNYVGPEQIQALLTDVFRVIKNPRYTSDVRDDSEAHLSLEATVAGLSFTEHQHLELSEDGLIKHVTLSMRPVASTTAFMKALAPQLLKTQRRPKIELLAVRFGGALLHSVANTGDRKFLPLADPHRSSGH